MTAKKLLFLLLAFTWVPALAQTLPVKGRVTDAKDHTALPGATVLLIRLPDSARTVTVCNTDGTFSFQAAPGAYLLRASFLGFQPLQRRITVADKALEVGELPLPTDAKMLGEVKITEQALTSVQKGDTTEFNAQAFKTNPDANADELVEKIPGVVMEEGKLKAQGEDVKRVLVDGKEFFGDDALATLKNLPAEVIDKIQVYDEQSERARLSGIDDGILNKTINIVTKPDKRNGKFGRGTVGAGTDGRYTAGGVLNIFKPNRRFTVLAEANNVNQQNYTAEDLLGAGIQGGRNSGGRNNETGTTTTRAAGLNYSQTWARKMSLTASYFGNFTDNTGFENAYRQYLVRRSIDESEEEEGYERENSNHRLNGRLEYQIDSSNTLFVQPRLSFQFNNSSTDFNSRAFLEDSPVNTSQNNTVAKLHGYNLSNELIYRHRFAKKGRNFSLSLHTSANKNAGDTFLKGLVTTFPRQQPRLRVVDQFRDRNTEGYNLNANFSYTEPLHPGGVLSLNYVAGKSRGESDRRTYLFDEEAEDYTNLNTRLSNTFTNDGTSHQSGLGYHYFSEKVKLTARASFQYSTLANERVYPSERLFDRSFTKFVPNASLTYLFEKKKFLRFVYSSTTTNPSVDQLQDVVDNTNTLRLRTGNPDLEQEYQHNFTLRYSALNQARSSTFVANLSGNVVQNNITYNRIINGSPDSITVYDIRLGPSMQLLRPENLDGYYNVRSFVSYGLPVKPIKTNLNVDLSADYNRQPGLSNDTVTYTYNQHYSFGLTLSSNISERIDFTLSSRSAYFITENTFEQGLNTSYFQQVNRARINWMLPANFYVNTVFSQRIYTGLNAGFNQNRKLWNVSVGKKLFANQRGDIRLSVVDALKENNSIQRRVNTTYIEDIQNQVLQRYYLLSFTYNLRQFGKGMGSQLRKSTKTPASKQDRKLERKVGSPGGGQQRQGRARGSQF
ncbi:MAG: outer membrane beta-barrel protein [Adhaeribacter sp.]